MRAAVALGLVLGLVLVLQARAEPQTHTIVIEGMQFSPSTITVRRGDRVVWQNKDLVPHTATAAGRFDSGTIDPGKSWRWVAGEPGTLPYVCTLHPTMKATLTVQ